jgi:type II secretory pathway component GspD/PulD (secretin)
MIRNMKLALAATALVAVVNCGNNAEGPETRRIMLAHISAEDAHMAIEPYFLDTKVLVRRSDEPAALTITGSPANVENIAQLLKQLDQPPPKVQLRFQIVEADGFTTRDSAIADVETALRELFRFRGYRLATEAMVSGQAGTTLQQTVLLRDEIPVTLTVEVPRVSRNKDAAAVELRIVMAVGSTNALSTAVTVPNGQTVVLGSARPLPNIGTLILVVRPQIE